MTKSSWKITHDPAGTPLVLLDHGDRLRGEISWNGRRGFQVADLIRAAAPAIYDRGNHTVEISYERFVTASTDAASREAILASLISLLALPAKPLRIHISGITAKYWQFSNSLITGHSPMRHIPGATPRQVVAITITATGLAQVTV